jgi:hypothetical protein
MDHIFWKLGNSMSPFHSPFHHSVFFSYPLNFFPLHTTSSSQSLAPHDRHASRSRTLLISRLAFKGWTFKSPQSRPTPPFFPEFTPSRSSSSPHYEQEDVTKYGHGLEQDLSHLRDMSGSGSGDSNTTITPGGGTMRCRALSF